MNSAVEHFVLPREQLLSSRFLRLAAQSASFPSASGKHRYLFFWARNALYHGLRALRIAPGDRVLLPSYICAAAVEPIVAYGASVSFYQIQSDCTPNFAEVEKLASSGADCLLAVHYFGFPQNIGAYRTICDKHGLRLIEDCAHVLQGETEGTPLGQFGDASIFSWRKFIPIYDGGELVLNRNREEFDVAWSSESALFTLKVLKNMVEKEMRFRHPVLEFAAGSLKTWLRKNGTSAPSRELATDNSSVHFDATLVNFPISRLSRFVLSHSDIVAIAAKRRKNYAVLRKSLSEIDGVRPLFGEFPATVCPLVFPLFFERLPNAHLALRKLKIPATHWGGVRPPQISKESFPDADFLFDNLVFLPIHQNLQEKELESIVKAVRTVRHQSF